MVESIPSTRASNLTLRSLPSLTTRPARPTFKVSFLAGNHSRYHSVPSLMRPIWAPAFSGCLLFARVPPSWSSLGTTVVSGQVAVTSSTSLPVLTRTAPVSPIPPLHLPPDHPPAALILPTTAAVGPAGEAAAAGQYPNSPRCPTRSHVIFIQFQQYRRHSRYVNNPCFFHISLIPHEAVLSVDWRRSSCSPSSHFTSSAARPHPRLKRNGPSISYRAILKTRNPHPTTNPRPICVPIRTL